MTTNIVHISVAKQFTKLPGARYRRLGPNSGEEFRETFLEPVLRVGDTVVVDLDGVRGYGSSFLEEAFGGVVRALGLSEDDALQRIQIQTRMAHWKGEVQQYMREAASTYSGKS